MAIIPTRSASLILPAYKSVGGTSSQVGEDDTAASRSAKRMMGSANPVVGSTNRKPGSVYNSAEGRYSRPGSASLMRSFLETYLSKGKKNGGGNPNHDEKGRFAKNPSSSGGVSGGGAAKDDMAHAKTQLPDHMRNDNTPTVPSAPAQADQQQSANPPSQRPGVVEALRQAGVDVNQPPPADPTGNFVRKQGADEWLAEQRAQGIVPGQQPVSVPGSQPVDATGQPENVLDPTVPNGQESAAAPATEAPKGQSAQNQGFDAAAAFATTRGIGQQYGSTVGDSGAAIAPTGQLASSGAQKLLGVGGKPQNGGESEKTPQKQLDAESQHMAAQRQAYNTQLGAWQQQFAGRPTPGQPPTTAAPFVMPGAR